MLDDGEVFNFEVESQQLHRCQNMEKHKHSTSTSNSKYKPTEFCAVGSFFVFTNPASLNSCTKLGLCSASPTLLFFFSFLHLSSNVELNKFIGRISYLCLCNPSPNPPLLALDASISYQLLSPHEPHEDNLNRERTFKETPHKPL
jgi:hypothetical protein